MYTASAWSGLVFRPKLTDSASTTFFSVESKDFAGFGQSADNKLLKSVLFNITHLLHRLLRDKSEALLHNNLRPRPHGA
jgi:hypothetical protein